MTTLKEENFGESKEFALKRGKNIIDSQKTDTANTAISPAPLQLDSSPMNTAGKVNLIGVHCSFISF